MSWCGWVFQYSAMGRIQLVLVASIRGVPWISPQLRWDGFTVDGDDVVFADDDGVLFVPSGRIEDVLKVARSIWKVERQQAETIRAGKKLSEQLDFDEFLAKRNSDPSYTFRRHLRERGGAVED